MKKNPLIVPVVPLVGIFVHLKESVSLWKYLVKRQISCEKSYLNKLKIVSMLLNYWLSWYEMLAFTILNVKLFQWFHGSDIAQNIPLLFDVGILPTNDIDVSGVAPHISPYVGSYIMHVPASQSQAFECSHSTQY